MGTKFADHLVLFAHLPKAGGSSLISALTSLVPASRVYNVHHQRAKEDIARFEALSLEQQQQYYLVHGHSASSLIPRVKRPVWAFTFLRDPVERVRSLYYYILESRTHPLHKIYENATLDEFVEREANGQVSNHQTDILLRGVPGTERLRDGQNRLRVDSPAHAEEIINGWLSPLLQTYRFIGLLEYFDESMVLLSNKLRTAPLFYNKSNVTTHKHRHKALTNAQRDVIASKVSLDQLLYEHVKRPFEDRIAQLGSDFENVVGEYRYINKTVGARAFKLLS
jgi:hypothetical protein